MLNIYVVDRTAESRSKAIRKIEALLSRRLHEIDLMPRINVKPVSEAELRFNAPPEILIVGPELVSRELTEIQDIRKLLPDTPLLAALPPAHGTLSTIEHLARMGVDDVFDDTAAPSEFIRKIILLSRRLRKTKSAKLIVVDSGKGGVGVTTIAAGLAAGAAEAGKRAVLCDLDSHTQDLSRFLGARPYVNETLELMLQRRRPVTVDFVRQALVGISEDEALCCMPPPDQGDCGGGDAGDRARSLISVFEVLDTLFDVIVVDLAGVAGAFRRASLGVADRALYVVNSDPATLFGSVHGVATAKGLLAPGATILIVENNLGRAGLSTRVVKQELLRAIGDDGVFWSAAKVGFSVSASRWPGSGGTIYGAGARARSGIRAILAELGVVEERKAERSPRPTMRGWMFGGKNKAPVETLPLPKLGLPIPSGPELVEMPTFDAGDDLGKDLVSLPTLQ